jgi:hypothetical protein
VVSANHQLERLKGFIATLNTVQTRVIDQCAIAARDGDLDLQQHTELIANLHSIENSAKMARECANESLRRKLRDEDPR